MFRRTQGSTRNLFSCCSLRNKTVNLDDNFYIDSCEDPALSSLEGCPIPQWVVGRFGWAVGGVVLLSHIFWDVWGVERSPLPSLLVNHVVSKFWRAINFINIFRSSLCFIRLRGPKRFLSVPRTTHSSLESSVSLANLCSILSWCIPTLQ